MRKKLTKLRGRRGQSYVEYGLILTLVALVIIWAVATIGETTSDSMNSIKQEIGAAG